MVVQLFADEKTLRYAASVCIEMIDSGSLGKLDFLLFVYVRSVFCCREMSPHSFLLTRCLLIIIRVWIAPLIPSLVPVASCSEGHRPQFCTACLGDCPDGIAPLFSRVIERR